MIEPKAKALEIVDKKKEAHAIRPSRSTLSADDYECFVKRIYEYYNSKPSVWVV